jgi:hypothetical protein
MLFEVRKLRSADTREDKRRTSAIINVSMVVDGLLLKKEVVVVKGI